MKLLFYLTYSVLLFLFVDARLNISNFVNVILDLRKFYSAATVIFAHPEDEYGDYGDIRVTHLVHSCFRMLGRHYVMTLDVHFGKMYRSLRYYHRIVQPIVIVVLSNYDSYVKFAEATKTYIMSFPVWFVVFLFTPANDAHDYCHQPMGNPFNLAFDTQMLVLCHDEDVLREWYSVKGETVKVFDLAKWVNRHGFMLLTKLSLYERRNDMEGAVLRAVTIKDIPVSPKHRLHGVGNYVANLYGKVLDELTYSLNFTLDVVSEVNENGMWNGENLTWSGVMGEVVSGRADFAIADMSMTSLRVQYVDFTLPLIISRNNLFIREPGICGVKWLGYFQTFHSRTWSAILTLIAIAPLLLWYMKKCRGSRNITNLISDNFICIWGIFCQQSLTEFPRYTSLRLAYFTIFCTAILVTAYYSAALVVFLTSCVRILPFHSIDEFVRDGTYKLIVPRGSADYDIISVSAVIRGFQTFTYACALQKRLKLHRIIACDAFVSRKDPTKKSFESKLMKLMKEESELPETLMGGFMQICKDRNLVYLILNALKKSVEIRIPCKLSSIGTERIDNLGMVLSKGNPYTGVINYHLQKFLDNGMMMRIKDTRFLMQSVENKAYESVHVINIVPILAILCGGAILSIVILTIERIHHLCKEKKEKRRRKLRILYPSKKQLFITK